MMTRVYLVLALALAVGCGEADDLERGAPGAGSGTEANHGARADALQLAPEVQLVGLGDLYEELEVTHLSFDAELFLLPDGDAQPASVAVRYVFSEDGARTILERPLALESAGRYQLLVRIRPGTDDGISVRLAAALDAFLDPAALFDREKGDEPAPIPAEPAPVPAEPAATPADSPEEPAPIPAEPAPVPAEPAPIPAESGPEGEPAPIPAEPAPIPAEPGAADEPAPIPARGKGEQAVAEVDDERDTVFVRSTTEYEFYAGTVEIGEDASSLVVTWDVRRWLRGMLAAPLGMQAAPDPVDPAPSEPGFTRPGGDEFRITAQ